MSRQGSSTVQRLMIGLAIGAVAVVVYNRRASLLALAGPRLGAALPSGSRELAYSGGSAMQNAGDTNSGRGLTGTLQGGPNALLAEARRYVESARKQLDVAIAEGQATAAQTRRDLEARFAQAKQNPDSARSAFM